jgi:hypothetical protein
VSAFDFLRSRPSGSPNRAEVALAEEHHLLARTAVLELQREVQEWSLRWGSQLSIEAQRDLYYAIGLSKKVRL